MDRLTITTHLIGVLTAFSAFTMPIALEVINRIKSRYGSAYYMDALEEIMGFKIKALFGQLIAMLIALLLFSLVTSAIPKDKFPAEQVLLVEFIFFMTTVHLLVKVFDFIKVIFLATRSDDLVTDYIIKKIQSGGVIEEQFSKEVELLIQIGCYNVEHTESEVNEQTIDNRIFEFIETSYKGLGKRVSPHIIESLLTGLSSMLSSARNTQNRQRYVYLLRNYYKHAVLFYDYQKDHEVRYSPIMSKLYEQSIGEVNADEHWLLKADFLIAINTWDIRNFRTLHTIDSHIRNLVTYLARNKPKLMVDVLDRYRSLHGYESYLNETVYQLSNISPIYSPDHFEEIRRMSEVQDDYLLFHPYKHFDNLILLLDKVVQSHLQNPELTPQGRDVLSDGANNFVEEVTHELVKKVGCLLSEHTAKFAIRLLSREKQWHSILDCYNSFSPIGSSTIRAGHSLLKVNINDVIDELGQSDFNRMFDEEELNYAYVKALPLLLMLSIYNWKHRQFNNIRQDAIDGLTASLKLKQRTIVKAKAIEKDISTALYFANSPSYSKSFCAYFGNEHEQDSFQKDSIKILESIEHFVQNEQLTLKYTQPLSDSIKSRFEQELKKAISDSLPRLPLLQMYVLTNTKQGNCQEYSIEETREAFLEDTGTYYSFNGLDKLQNIHNKLAFQLIKAKGRPIRELNLNNIKPSQVLLITPMDWEAVTDSIDLRKRPSINKCFVHTRGLLHKYFIHDTQASKPYVTLYGAQADDSELTIECAYQNTLETQFIDSGEKVAVKFNYHIYLNKDLE